MYHLIFVQFCICGIFTQKFTTIAAGHNALKNDDYLVESEMLDPSAQKPNNDAAAIYDEDGSPQCVPITEPVCQGLHYAKTYMPNAIGLSSQEEAARRMSDYQALLSIGCTRYLKFFLCTVYFPMCAPSQTALRFLQPCKNFCLYIQSKCEPIMKSFDFPWPKELNCDRLPSSSDVCIHPENYDLDQTGSAFDKPMSGLPAEKIVELLPELKNLVNDKFVNENVKPLTEAQQSIPNSIVQIPGNRIPQNKPRKPKSECEPFEIQILTDKSSKNLTCAPRCSSHIFYRREEKQFAEVWILVWSVLCFASSCLTVLSFISDRGRFAYPERPIIYISFCYLCYSLGYLLRVGLGRQRVACREHVTNVLMPSLQNLISGLSEKASDPVKWGPESTFYLIPTGHEETWCTIVFITLFYFSQASYVWWVMLSITWFLSTVCQWGREGIEAVSSILHMLAWSLPALKTMLVLILHKIDADELTGLCNVGYQDPRSLLYFVIVPQTMYLSIGLVLFVIGFFALISVRTNLKRQLGPELTNRFARCGTLEKSKLSLSTDVINIKRLDKLMVKMCIFSMLYIIPSVCVVAARLYNFNGYFAWKTAIRLLATRPGCQSETGTVWSSSEQCLEGIQLPSVEVNMLQIFMSLVIGITTGMWIWLNRKTFAHWSQCCSNKAKHFETGECKILLSNRINRKTTSHNSGSRSHVPSVERRNEVPQSPGTDAAMPVHTLTSNLTAPREIARFNHHFVSPELSSRNHHPLHFQGQVKVV